MLCVYGARNSSCYPRYERQKPMVATPWKSESCKKGQSKGRNQSWWTQLTCVSWQSEKWVANLIPSPVSAGWPHWLNPTGNEMSRGPLAWSTDQSLRQRGEWKIMENRSGGIKKTSRTPLFPYFCSQTG